MRVVAVVIRSPENFVVGVGGRHQNLLPRMVARKGNKKQFPEQDKGAIDTRSQSIVVFEVLDAESPNSTIAHLSTGGDRSRPDIVVPEETRRTGRVRYCCGVSILTT